MSRHTIDRYWNRTSFLQKVSHQKSNLLDFEDYLIKRWQEGDQQVKVLFEEIEEQGFKHNIKLAAWCHEVINDENENIKGFARGILRRAAFRIFKLFIRVLSQIGVTDQWKRPPLRDKSTGSKILNDKCMVVQGLSFFEKGWWLQVKGSFHQNWRRTSFIGIPRIIIILIFDP